MASISDGRTLNRGNRTMSYDGLDRLKTTASPMFGNAAFAYNTLDDLTRVTIGGSAARDHYYCYDVHFQLTNVKTGSCNGASVIGLGYDVRGNLANKNGVLYQFDYGNRLREVVGVERYRYDTLGRRVETTKADQTQRLWQYSQAGQLMFGWTGPNNPTTHEYVYLAGSLVAIVDHAGPDNAVTAVKYQHTDALGSPVAVTDANRTVIEQSEYEPYGYLLNRPLKDGPGYAGHVSDAATGLSYMQQRYYDPKMGGRFLSVDPVTATSVGGNFNRYWYANNNPYRFTDPDGRRSKEEHDHKREQAEKRKERKKEQDRARNSDMVIKPVAQKANYPTNAKNGQEIQALFAVGYMDGSAARTAANRGRAAAKQEGLPGDRNGPWDAMRHCNAACEVARTLNPKDAILLGDIHEAWYPNKSDEQHMDMFNNRFGANNSGSNSTCPGLCRGALDAGYLEVLPKSRWDQE